MIIIFKSIIWRKYFLHLVLYFFFVKYQVWIEKKQWTGIKYIIENIFSATPTKRKT